jgi:hypothetical protein
MSKNKTRDVVELWPGCWTIVPETDPAKIKSAEEAMERMIQEINE